MTFDPELNDFADWARRAPEADPKQLKCLIICGLPGSGKSTYAAHLLKTTPDMILICPDTIREELTGDVNDQSRNPFIFGTLVPCRIAGARSQEKGTILDACSVSRKSRKGLIAVARQQGYWIEAHVLDRTPEECKARNAGRDRKVPSEVIERMWRAWAPPTVGEVDAVINVPRDWQDSS